MKKVINVLVIIAGAFPLMVGSILNKIMLEKLESVLPLLLIGLLFLNVWLMTAFLFQNRMKNTKRVVVLLNAIAAIDLLLLAIQELVIHAYWGNMIGVWSQLFYLPIVKFGFMVTSWSHTMFSAYAASFILMLAVSLLGCKISIWQCELDKK